MKETRIIKYIKGIIRNHKYTTTEDIMLMLEKYYKLPIKTLLCIISTAP